MKDTLLILFARNPVLGKVKTRLAATIGAEAALNIYRRLLWHTMYVTRPLSCDKVAYYADFIPGNDIFALANYRRALQDGHNLGERMHNAFKAAFAGGYQKVCIIGSDCPQVSTAIILEAFDTLERKEAMIGPASDGGYYLLGMRQMQERLFVNKQWSTDTVLIDTIKDLKDAGLSYGLLPVLTDVDEEKDLYATNLKLMP